MTTLAGWAKDPYGRYEQRYWDGVQWTDHVANGSLQGTDPIADLAIAAKPLEALTPEDRAELGQLATVRLKRSARRWVIGFGVGTLVLVGVLILVPDDDGPWTGDGSALAQRACGNATLALGGR